MYLLYSLALSLLFLALLPYFVYQAIRHGKYAGSFRQRMGWLPPSMRADGRKTVWVHAVSVGELLAARPLIERIRREFSDRRLVISTATATGQRLARSQAEGFSDGVFYFPFDLRFSSRRSLAQIDPQLVIILETELWPNFLRECRRRGTATVVVNGRISPRSFSRYTKARRFIARALNDISMLVMQSEPDAERARMLGARPDRVRVCGNLKYDIPAGGRSSQGSNADADVASDSAREIDRQFELSSCANLIVAGSTAPGEEEILLAALGVVRGTGSLRDARLLVAPRHPERFDVVAALIARSGFTFARRSEAAARGATGNADGGAGRPQPPDVILLDTIGELAALYEFATVVFVGGSLVPRGGHNVIEPAAHAKPIIVGPHTENFRQITSDFAGARALVEVAADGADPADALAREFIRLLSDRQAAQAMGARARDILSKNRGATDCAMAAIKSLDKE